MLIRIPEVFTSAEAAAIRQEMEAADWTDGGVTAGAQSGAVKRNRQLPEASPLARSLGERVLDALGRAPLFVSAALPLKTFPPLFNRYGPGEGFGTHVDNAIRPVRGTAARVRTDLSATLFFSEPGSYDGGELVVEGQFGAQAVKLAAGDLILYPASSLHHVTEVTRGERISSFFWVQSMVRSDEDRALLFDLDQEIQTFAGEHGVDHPHAVKLSQIYHNLIRRWADA